MTQAKVVLITGASGGLGLTVTRAFLDDGATVVGVSPSIAQDAFPKSSFVAMPGDISSGEAAKDIVDRTVERFQRIDALVHLVGGFSGGKPVQDTDDASFDRMIDVNLRSAFLMVRAVLPQMQKQRQGRILAIGSKSATGPAPLAALYGASKAALVSLILSVAAENKDAGISANVVMPGTIDTPANRLAMPAVDPAKWIQPSQIGRLLVNLVSDELSQINGAVIPIFGVDS